ncbi:hypothetical protein AUP42_07170 [Thalassospira lucentensis]|uniref:Uncharacterized protein n=1 Tax=Thalassospira lucentensis TaxID=168935 RepID=A0A154L0I6_9PROT|nr:hypothetical protein AUP42_07170 [Thalassospira lucentensis]
MLGVVMAPSPETPTQRGLSPFPPTDGLRAFRPAPVTLGPDGISGNGSARTHFGCRSFSPTKDGLRAHGSHLSTIGGPKPAAAIAAVSGKSGSLPR